MPRTPLNAPWTKDEVAELKELLLKGKSLASLAVHFKKRPAGVITKLRKLGLPSPFQVHHTIPKGTAGP